MKKVDYLLFSIVLALLGIGILILSGVSAVYSFRDYGTTSYYLNRQLFFIVGGLILAFIVYKIPLKTLKKMAFPAFLISIFLMFLTLLPGLGIEMGGARRWFNLGIITFQPAELLKLTLIFYLANWLPSKKEKIFLPFIVIVFFVSLSLYLQRDLSTFVIIIAIALTLYFLARKSLWENIGIWAGVASIVYFFTQTEYRWERILTLLGLSEDILGAGFQAHHVFISIGSGGFWGRGLGFSSQKFLVPHAMSDSIFAIIAEEGGFIIAFLVLFLFFLFFWRCFNLAKKNKDRSIQLIIIGIGVWFLIQALINTGAMTGVLPITGVPLPLISYGGSHILMELVALGLLFNVLKFSKK